MSRLGDGCVRWCDSMRLIPAAVLCLLFFIIQCAVMDYYMAYYITISYLLWIIADVFNVVLLTLAIVFAYRAIHSKSSQTNFTDGVSIAWVAWLCQSVSLSAKLIIIFEDTSIELDDKDFFGPNTLKTTVSFSSIIFFLVLMTQHNASLETDQRRYIENLTGTVLFDVLDTVDILDVLFDADTRQSLWPAIDELILTVATLNLVLPALPLLTLSITKFGEKMLSMKMLYMHRIVLILLVNFPNLVLRLLLWHGMSAGITPFVLKNALMICLVFFEFYEHKREKYFEHLEEVSAMEKGSVQANGHNVYFVNKSNSHEMDDRGSNKLKFGDVDEGFIMESRVMSFV